MKTESKKRAILRDLSVNCSDDDLPAGRQVVVLKLGKSSYAMASDDK